jgi:hypothetical protein
MNQPVVTVVTARWLRNYQLDGGAIVKLTAGQLVKLTQSVGKFYQAM